MVVSKAVSEPCRSSRGEPCNPAFQPPNRNLTVRSEFVGTRPVPVSLVFHPPSRHGTLKRASFSSPPFENGIQDSLSPLLERGEIEVQHIVELAIELAVVRHDGAVNSVAQSRRDIAVRIGGVPAQILIPLPRIAVLKSVRLAFISRTSTEHVSISELFVRIARLTAPVLDLHRVRIRSDTSHAVAAQAPLLGRQRTPKRVLVRVVVVVAMWSLAMRGQARRFRFLGDSSHASPVMKSRRVRMRVTSESSSPRCFAKSASSARTSS